MNILSRLSAIKNEGKRRAGRGYGSKKGGHTSGRGMKGQLSRNGGKRPLWFEGGQLPLVKRLPWQRGKGRLKSLNIRQEVHLRDIVKHNLVEVNPETLLKAGLIDTVNYPVRIISVQPIEVALTLKGVEASQSVKAVIEKAGGSVQA
jgi:large subunit ribosomal protein L15